MRGFILAALLASFLAGCATGWRNTSGLQTIPPFSPPGNIDCGDGPATPSKGYGCTSGEVSVEIPKGWMWCERGGGLVASRDGPFLQHIAVERFHVRQKRDPFSTEDLEEVHSAMLWPLRTRRNLKSPLVPNMEPYAVGQAIMESRRNDPAARDLNILGIDKAEVGGLPGFCADYTFRLYPVVNIEVVDLQFPWPPPFFAMGRRPEIRGRYCGAIVGEWFYGVAFEAAGRYYWERDSAAFDAALATLRLPK